MQKPVILFDFDGVILDSYSVAFSFNQSRCDHYDHDSYRALFRGNVNDMARNSHTPECKRNDEGYFEAYGPHMEGAIFFEGAEEFIRRLAKSYRLIIISSCTTDLITRSLAKHGVEKEFVEILGNDVAESKVEKIKDVFKGYELLPEKTIFITDTVGDVREAREAGVAAIAVTWGYHSVEWLREANPLHLVHSIAELESAIDDFFKR